MNLRAKGFLVMLLVLGLISCTSSRTMVSTAPESRLVVKTINLVEGKHTVTVPEEIKESFKNKLELALFGTSEGQPPAFSKGSAPFLIGLFNLTQGAGSNGGLRAEWVDTGKAPLQLKLLI